MIEDAGTVIDTRAWLSFASRGKRANLARSLGSVRYDASPKTAGEIARRAQTEEFDPNLIASREAALERIAHLRNALSRRPKRAIEAPSEYSRQTFVDRLEFLPDLDVMEVNFSAFTFRKSADVDGFYDYIEH